MFEARSDVPCFDSMNRPTLSFLCFPCTNAFVPGGTMGAALISKISCNEAYADNDGYRRDEQSKFRVKVHCGIRRTDCLRGIVCHIGTIL